MLRGTLTRTVERRRNGTGLTLTRVGYWADDDNGYVVAEKWTEFKDLGFGPVLQEWKKTMEAMVWTYRRQMDRQEYNGVATKAKARNREDAIKKAQAWVRRRTPFPRAKKSSWIEMERRTA